MGDGHFIIPLNAEMRKALKKQKGAELYVQLEKDDSPIKINHDLISCLEDEPAALRFFNHFKLHISIISANGLKQLKAIPLNQKELRKRSMHVYIIIHFQKCSGIVKKIRHKKRA